MSVLPELRGQLVRAAAHRQPAERPGALRRVQRGFRILPALFALLVAAAIAVVAVTELRHRAPLSSDSSVADGKVAGRHQLIEMLAPLQRPQTAGDLKLSLLSRPRGPGLAGLNGVIDRPLVRYAATTPWGERLFIVPMRPASAAQIAAEKRRYPELRRAFARSASRGETVGLFGSGGGGGFATPASLERYGEGETEGGSGETRVISLVPDGVARVEFLFARQPAGSQYGGPLYPHVLRVTVAVHDNIAAAQVHRASVGGGEATIWYNAAGQTLRRIGNFAALNRVVKVRQPGPQTPASRAAQRNPSTPNPVWVTPAVGSPSTVFRVHFRVLLNGADYRYRITGTRCSHYTFPGGTGNPDALRGSIWNDSLNAVQGQKLCPGTYHVSVSVMSAGRYSRASRPAIPHHRRAALGGEPSFGHATFIVR